jgi:hypothetical protein
MSPTAVYASSPDLVVAPLPSKGLALVIGSLSTAKDGNYKTLISQLEESRQVDRQMLDRLMDGGIFGSPPEYLPC